MPYGHSRKCKSKIDPIRINKLPESLKSCRQNEYPEDTIDASNISYADSRKSSSDSPSKFLEVCISLLKEETPVILHNNYRASML